MRFILKSFLIGIFFVLAVPTKAQDFDLTPSHVYNIWSNINKTLVVLEQNHPFQSKISAPFGTLKSKNFSGKKPKDALVLVKKFGTLFEYLSGIDHSKEYLLAREVVFQGRDNISDVTPSIVYLHSAHLLVEAVTVISKLPSFSAPLSPFFEDQKFVKKMPSDVFGLVDLAIRRLNLIGG